LGWRSFRQALEQFELSRQSCPVADGLRGRLAGRSSLPSGTSQVDLSRKELGAELAPSSILRSANAAVKIAVVPSVNEIQ
jgi:hypothetical protein